MVVATTYFVVPAPGHYGDVTTVISSHASLAAARKAAGTRAWCVRIGRARKGDTFRRSDEQRCPLAETT